MRKRTEVCSYSLPITAVPGENVLSGFPSIWFPTWPWDENSLGRLSGQSEEGYCQGECDRVGSP